MVSAGCWRAKIHEIERAEMDVARRGEADAKVVMLKLNKQQLELIDRTIASGVAPDRVALVKLALREYAISHGGARREKRAP